MPDSKKWVKWWVDAPGDPRVKRIPKHLRWAFPALLCLAKKSGREGYLELDEGVPYTMEDMAGWCDFTVEEMKQAVSYLCNAFVTEFVTHENGASVMRFRAWDKRQYSESYDRVRKHRERANMEKKARLVTPGVTGGETREVELDLEGEGEKEERQDLKTKSIRSKAKSHGAEKTVRAFVLPTTICPQVWGDFEEHRRKKRSPMTERAKMLIVSRIEKINQNPNELIEQSIERGWIGIFPLKDNGGSGGEPKGFAGLREYQRQREEKEGEEQDLRGGHGTSIRDLSGDRGEANSTQGVEDTPRRP